MFPPLDYLYIFVKHPKDEGLKFVSRTDDHDFNSMINWNNVALEDRIQKYKEGIYDKHMDPGMVLSYDEIVPDFVAVLQNKNAYKKKFYRKAKTSPPDEYVYKVLKPTELKGETFSIYTPEGEAIPFNQIEPIKKALPKIHKAHPFIEPDVVDGRYVYEGWNQDSL